MLLHEEVGVKVIDPVSEEEVEALGLLLPLSLAVSETDAEGEVL